MQWDKKDYVRMCADDRQMFAMSLLYVRGLSSHGFGIHG